MHYVSPGYQGWWCRKSVRQYWSWQTCGSKYIEKWAGPFPERSPALEGHYWICGNQAYKMLHKNWTGKCYIGVIQPFFLLPPVEEGNQPGIKVYEELQHQKRPTDVSIIGNSAQNWKGNEWTPQHIIQHYGPAPGTPTKLFMEPESLFTISTA